MAKPRESTALVVVDMQSGFNKANNKIAKNSQLLIEGAVKDKVPIIFLEIPGNGKTHRHLVEPTLYYRKKRLKKKNISDGSVQVKEACKELRIKPKHFVVCGVNYTACVHETILGLRRFYPNSRITLIKEATNYSTPTYYGKIKKFKLLTWRKKKK